jgi:hypothetical protein
MSIGEEKQWKDLQELRKMYSLKDTRTRSGSLTAHGLRLALDLEGYRKDIQELNRLFALEDPRSKGRGEFYRKLHSGCCQFRKFLLRAGEATNGTDPYQAD